MPFLTQPLAGPSLQNMITIIQQTFSGTRAGGNIDIVANLVTNHNKSVEEAIAVSERVGGWKKDSKTREKNYDKEHLLQKGMNLNVLTDPNNPLSLYDFSHITNSTTTAHGYKQVRNYHTHLTIVKISNSSLCSSRHQVTSRCLPRLLKSSPS